MSHAFTAARARSAVHPPGARPRRRSRRTAPGLVAVALVASLLTAVPAASAGAAPADELDVLRVLHWNIAGVTNSVGDPTKPANLGRFEVVDRLLEIADGRDPHLVSLNETCEQQAAITRDALRDGGVSAEMSFAQADGTAPLCDADLGSPGQLFSSGSAVIAVGADAVSDRSQHYLTEDGGVTDEPTDRQAACLTASFESSLGRTVRACSLHLSPVAETAERQASAFAAFSREQWGDLPLVLAGDFNAEPPYLTGVYAPEQGGTGSFLEASYDYEQPTFYDGRKLDYVFADRDHFGPSDGLVAEVVDRGVCDKGVFGLHPCSDHFAYYALLPFLTEGTPPSDGTGPTVSAGPDVVTDEGAPVALKGVVRNADASTATQWTVEPTTADPGATCTFGRANSPTTTVTCTDDGTYTVTLTATDGVHPPASDSAVVTVRNTPPRLTLTGPADWALFRVGTPVPLGVDIADAPNDSHTCSVLWDDGTGADTYDAAPQSCDRAHTFTDAGMYTITVRATDDDGAVSEPVQVMVVVYDPAAGSTNADGSVASPAGSLRFVPELGGEEWFHLVAQYRGASATVPTGTAKAWLKNTSFLRFDAGTSGLDWLVVTKDGKTAAKGRGVVDRVEYGFVFYGYDGCTNGATTGCQPGPDRFRVVLWPLSEGPNPGDLIDYDNSRGAGYDVDVALPGALTSGAVLLQR